MALGLLFQARPRGTFRTYSDVGIDQPTFAVFKSTTPRTGPMRRLEYKMVLTKAKWAGQGGTKHDNLATVGRDWVPGARTRTDAMRQIRKTVYHERGHQWLNRNLSAFGRPALWLKLGAYKRSYLLRYAEEFIAEFNAQRRMGQIGDEPLAYKFPVNASYEITYAKLGEEVVGILLGPVTIGGAIYQVYYGLIHADH